MEYARIYEILKNKDIQEIYYEDKPVWIQELKENTATIGFLDGSAERDVYIEDLYEDEFDRPKKEAILEIASFQIVDKP